MNSPVEAPTVPDVPDYIVLNMLLDRSVKKTNELPYPFFHAQRDGDNFVFLLPNAKETYNPSAGKIGGKFAFEVLSLDVLSLAGKNYKNEIARRLRLIKSELSYNKGLSEYTKNDTSRYGEGAKALWNTLDKCYRCSTVQGVRCRENFLSLAMLHFIGQYLNFDLETRSVEWLGFPFRRNAVIIPMYADTRIHDGLISTQKQVLELFGATFNITISGEVTASAHTLDDIDDDDFSNSRHVKDYKKDGSKDEEDEEDEDESDEKDEDGEEKY